MILPIIKRKTNEEMLKEAMGVIMKGGQNGLYLFVCEEDFYRIVKKDDPIQHINKWNYYNSPLPDVYIGFFSGDFIKKGEAKILWKD